MATPLSSPSPLVSLVLGTKNALPHLRDAIEALKRQTYRNFEVLVQDGVSTDGTLEYLRSVEGIPRIDIVSESDAGIGQAYNRALARSAGDIVCFISADEFLDDDALEKGVAWFLQHPEAVVVYGGVRLVDETGQVFQTFIPLAFDWSKVIRNEMVVPMAATFLNRKRVGADLYYDESLKTCPDYDFWLRVGLKHNAAKFARVPDPIVTARADRTSMSFRAESFSQLTKDKLFILSRYLRSGGEGKDVAALRASASAGILMWAAESIFSIEGASPEFLKQCRGAADFDANSARLSELARRSEAFEIDADGRFKLKPLPQPHAPKTPTESIDGILKPEETRAETWWEGAKVEHGASIRVTTVSAPWGYSAVIPIACGPIVLEKQLDPNFWYWAKLNIQVRAAEIGLGLFAPDNIYEERVVSTKAGQVDVFIRMNHPGAIGVMIRNGPRPGSAAVEIFSATAERVRKPGV